MKFKIIENVDGGDGDMAIYQDGECIFHDHGHNLNVVDLLIGLGYEVEIVDGYDAACVDCGELDCDCECEC